MSENRLCIGQQRVADKSNEIDPRVPLLKRIDSTDAVVSSDPMGCQTAVAQQILTQNGHYLLALKGNQESLLEEVKCAFGANRGRLADEAWAYSRSRFEERRCWLLSARTCIDESFLAQWPGLQSLVEIEARRTQSSGRQTEVGYYIRNEEGVNPVYYSELARGHWGVENHLHWHLDVTFKEDACRLRGGHGPETLATLRKLALQLLTQQTDRLSLQKRRVKAAYAVDYLKRIIT